jgi:hypothetical protein
VKNRLERIQYRTDLLDGFLARPSVAVTGVALQQGRSNHAGRNAGSQARASSRGSRTTTFIPRPGGARSFRRGAAGSHRGTETCYGKIATISLIDRPRPV